MSCLVVSSQEYHLRFHKDFSLEIVEADKIRDPKPGTQNLVT